MMKSMIPCALVAMVAISPIASLAQQEEARNYPLGAIGGQYRITPGATHARIVSMPTGTPGHAAGLQVNDFIVGAFGKPFTPTGTYHYGVSQDLGFAVDRAEGEGGTLPLKVLRAGVGGLDITVQLPAAGAFSPAYPRNDAKSAEVYENAVAFLHQNIMASSNVSRYEIGWTGLVLLGHPDWNQTTGPRPYRLSVNKIRDYVIARIYNNNYAPTENLLLDGTSNPNGLGGMSNWRLGQKVMFLAELWAKTEDNTPIQITVGGSPTTVTLQQALQRGMEMCANTVQWWKQPAQHSNGFSPEYDRMYGMSGHSGVTGDYMHQGWFSGVNMTGIYSYNGIAFSRRAGMDLSVRPKDGHYFGFDLNPGDPIPASIANALPSSITLPKYADDPVRGITISNTSNPLNPSDASDPFWYDPSVNQKFLMQMHMFARRSAWYSAGHNNDGMVGYAPETISSYDAGGRTPGTLLGMAMYQQDVGGLDSDDLNRMESLKGYITRRYMQHQEAHAYNIGAQVYQQFCTPFLSDRQQRFFMENWRFFYALSRTHDGGFQYFRARSTNDNYLNETRNAAINNALPYAIANGGYVLIPPYNPDRLLVGFGHPDITWPTIDARSLKLTTTTTSIPFQVVDGDGQPIDPTSYTATWVSLSADQAAQFGEDATTTEESLTLYSQNNPPDSTGLPSTGYGNYRGFSFEPGDSALKSAGGSPQTPDLRLNSLTLRRSVTNGSTGAGAVYLKIYTSQTPTPATWVGDSTNTGDLRGGISEANVTFQFDSLPLNPQTKYYVYIANTPGNLAIDSITWNTGRIRISNNSAHTYPSGNLINTSWGNQDTSMDALFSAAIDARHYSAPASPGGDTLTFSPNSSQRLELHVTNGTHTVVEPINVTVVPPIDPPPMAILTQPQSATTTLGGSVNLTITTAGPTPQLYQWRRNGQPIGTATFSPTLALNNVSGGAEGVYDCIFTTELGVLVSDTATVTISDAGGTATGGLWREVFTGISGTSVANLTSNSKFPYFADASGVITSAASPSNFGDNFGERWTGWITPEVSGNYRFYLASDDDSELWLGTNELPTSANRILQQTGAVGEKQWSARSPSAWIYLQAGKRYYFEVLHKEGTAADHCAVAWQLEGAPAPVNGSGEIPGSFLSHRVGGIYQDTALPNSPPTFAQETYTLASGTTDQPYTGTVAGLATDPDPGDTITYRKLSGPAWLTIASDGTLAGLPGFGNVGENTFLIEASDDGNLTDTATLVIHVSMPDGGDSDFYFLDVNGTAPGSGIAANDTLTWDTAAIWSTDPSGESATSPWVDGAYAIIAAASDATGSYQINLTDTKTLSGLALRSGSPLLSDGGILPMESDTPVEVTTPSATINSIISGNDRGIAKTGTGTLILGGNNTYTAGTTLDAGTIQVGNANAIGTGALTIHAGAFTSGATQLSLANPISLEGNATFTGTADAQGLRFNGIINGNGGISKQGSGRVSLANDTNTFSGATTVNQGILAITPGAIANSSSVHIAAGGGAGGLAIGSNGTTTINNLTGDSTAVIRSDFNFNGNGNRILSVNQSADGTYAGTFTQGGSRTIFLVKEGTATLTLTNSANTYTGGTTINAGTLRIGANSNSRINNGNYGGAISIASGATLQFHTSENQQLSGVLSGNGTLRVDRGIIRLQNANNTFSGRIETTGSVLEGSDIVLESLGSSNGTPDLHMDGGRFILANPFVGNIATIGNLTGSDGVINPMFGSNAGVRTLQVTQTTDGEFAGNIQLSEDRDMALIKAGPATLTLSGTAHDYTGPTQIHEGTLAVTGTLGATAVTVASDATLAGNGDIGGSVTIQSGATHALEVANIQGAQVTRNIGGELVLEPGNILSLSAAITPTPGSYTLVTAAGGITGTPGTVILPEEINGTVSVSGNNLILDVSPPTGDDDYLYYMDFNGNAPGSGIGLNDQLTWGSAPIWSANPLGTTATFAWWDTAHAIIAAGDDATGAYQITLDGTKIVRGLTLRSGTPLLTGGAIEPMSPDTPFTVTTQNARIDSVIQGSARGIVKNGAGTLILGGSNIFTGNLRIAQGILELAPGGKLYNGGYTNEPVITVETGATWRMPNYSYSGVGQLADYRQRRVLEGGTIEVTGNSHSSGQDFTVTGQGGTFRYTPSGQTLTLSGNNNTNIRLDGPLTFDAIGTISVTGSSAILEGTGALVKTGSGTLILGNAGNSFAGDVTVNAGLLRASALTASAANSSLGSKSATRNITVNAPGAMEWTSNNILGGSGMNVTSLPDISLNGGTLTTTRFNTLGNLILSGATLLNANATDPVTYDGFQFIGSVTASGASPSSITTTTGRGNHLLGNASTEFAVTEPSGYLTVTTILRNGSNDYPGTAQLLKTGPGTLELSAANTYTGPTTVDEGTLHLTGSLASPVTVANGGTLSGNGTVNGTVSVAAGGTLAPTGNAILTTGTLDMAAGSSLAITITAGSAGRLHCTGNASLDDAALVITGTPEGSQPILILSHTGSRSGQFDADASTIPDGWEITYHDDAGEVRLSAITPPGGYDSWISDFETGGFDGFTDDPSGDGISNGLNFVLHGGDPLTPNSAQRPAITTDLHGVDHFTFRRAARARSHVTIRVEFSDDLTTWPEHSHLEVGETTANSSPGVTITPNDEFDEISVPFPSDVIRKFARIHVTKID